MQASLAMYALATHGAEECIAACVSLMCFDKLCEAYIQIIIIIVGLVINDAKIASMCRDNRNALGGIRNNISSVTHPTRVPRLPFGRADSLSHL